MRWNQNHNTLSLTKPDVAELVYILGDWKHCGMDGEEEAENTPEYQKRMKVYKKWMSEITEGQ